MDQNTINTIKQILGRTPRGLQEVMVKTKKGDPVVLRVSSLVDQQPFPTMFWLIDPTLKKKLDRLEASGLIEKLENEIAQDEVMKQKLHDDHNRYIKLRESFITKKEKEYLISHNFYDRFKSRGIGGISDFTRIRCLHMHYAFHLVSPSFIGQTIEKHLA